VGISGIIEQLASKRKLGALVMMTRIKRPIIRSIISGIINKLKDLSGSWFDNHQWKDADLWYDGGPESPGAPEAPEAPNSCNELPDSTDPMPFKISGNGNLYIRGTHSNWEPLESVRMKYKGNDIYQAIIELSGPVEFRLASSDEAFRSQVWIENEEKTGVRTEDVELGVIYNVAYLDSETLNNQGNFALGMYDITLQLNVPDPFKGFSVGTISIRSCS